MHITKIGHCCLLIEANGARILTDPGNFSTEQNDLENLDAILVTHEHVDHFHLDSVKAILAKNPSVELITNTAVAKLLDEAGLKYTLLTDKQNMKVKELLVEAFECPHAEIYKGMPRVLNTGFFIGEKLFYPGDAFLEPHKAVDILALPVAGPWMKISEALDYAVAVKPRVAFPVHDAIYKNPEFGSMMISRFLPALGIEVKGLKAGESAEF